MKRSPTSRAMIPRYLIVQKQQRRDLFSFIMLFYIQFILIGLSDVEGTHGDSATTTNDDVPRISYVCVCVCVLHPFWSGKRMRLSNRNIHTGKKKIAFS